MSQAPDVDQPLRRERWRLPFKEEQKGNELEAGAYLRGGWEGCVWKGRVGGGRDLFFLFNKLHTGERNGVEPGGRKD